MLAEKTASRFILFQFNSVKKKFSRIDHELWGIDGLYDYCWLRKHLQEPQEDKVFALL